MTPDQEARANDAANLILHELAAAQTEDECEAIATKHAKTFARLQQVHNVRAIHIINLASMRKTAFNRAQDAANKQQMDMFR